MNTTMFAFDRREYLLSVVAIAMVIGLGCSKGVRKVTVDGTISYKGQPLQSGLLQFVGSDGSYSVAEIQPGGKFIITDVIPGTVKVAVQEAPGGTGSSDEKGSPSTPKAPTVSLPDKYRDPQTSGVEYTITPETKERKIELD